MKNIIVFSLILLSLIIGCTKRSTSHDENLDWIANLIAEFEQQPVGDPPQSIWQYTYKCQTVYYVPAQCCDLYSTLYNANGERICAPDGGFTGLGDGKCPDFFQEQKNEKLIWQDPRGN
jgi:hypothetical protein